MGLHAPNFAQFKVTLAICFLHVAFCAFFDNSGFYSSGWEDGEGAPVSGGSVRIHKKRHTADLWTSDDITFSDDLGPIPNEPTTPLLDQPGDGAASWSNFDNLSPNTITSLCFAQCKAMCSDRYKVTYATKDVSMEAVCGMTCSSFKNISWMSSCQHDNYCIANCKFLTNETSEDNTMPLLPDPPTLSLEQVSAKEVNLTWPAEDHDMQDDQFTTYYVIEYLDSPLRSNWTFLNKTCNNYLLVNVDDVCNTDISFRLAAVNRYGTLGYTDSSNVTRRALPRPGTVTNLMTNNVQLINREFKLYFYWDAPQGWTLTDVFFEVPPQKSKNCSKTTQPPVPKVRQIKLTEMTMQLEVIIPESAYSCIYKTEIIPESRCGIKGIATAIIFDVSDCNKILGKECEDNLHEPGYVQNIAATPMEEPRHMLITWREPNDLGGHEKIDKYTIVWGPVPLKRFSLERENFMYVNGSETSAVIQTLRSGKYNLWITAHAYNVKKGEYQPSNRSAFLGWPDFNFTSYEYLGTTIQYTNGPTISKKVTSPRHPDTTSEQQINIESDKGENTVVYVIGAVTGILLLAVLSLVGYRRWRHTRQSKDGWGSPSSLLTYDALIVKKQAKSCLVDNPFYEFNRSRSDQDSEKNDRWEIPTGSLVLGKVLGQGAFGQVVKARLKLCHLPWENWAVALAWNNTDKVDEVDVAVKLLLEYADDIHCADFMKEIDLMKSIGAHPNVVSMLGCCTVSKPLYLVVEHMPHGDLLHYLRKHRHLMQEAEDRCAPEDRLTVLDLLSFARQTAVGMEFLSQKGFVHRDLASRNILVGEKKTVKIGDFGLTRYIYDDKVYVTKKGGKLPLKWMAIESIFDLTFTTSSDVWSFGVVLFELITLGGTPYPTIANKDLLRELQSGHRMEKPDNCPAQLYEMMRSCWEAIPSKRPSFSQLRVLLETIIEEMSSAKYLSIEVDENRDYYVLDDSDSDNPISRTRAVSMPEMMSVPSWKHVTSSSTDDNISHRSCSTNSTMLCGSTATSGHTSIGQTSNGQTNDKDGLENGQNKAAPNKVLRPASDSKATGRRKRADLFRVSTCSNDELLPRSTSTSDGAVVLDCSSLESVGETEL